MFFDKRFKSTLLTSVSMGAVLIGTNALANPEGANVVTGDVAINGLGTDHVIIQNDSNRAVVNWDKFSIGAGETTTINQITDDSAILNRVVTNNVSEIYGTLESNGQVFLVNQSGIVIGASGIVDTNGLVASTLDVSNTDFLGAGEMIFSQGIQKGGGIEVHGKIRSVSGGDIFLLSREITIGASGEISSEGGYVGLGAGEEILLKPTDTGDGRISIRAGKGKIVNQGTIAGIAAELKAAGGNEYALAINNTGVVRATGYSKKGGKIRLGGGGKVRNTGKLVARKKVIVRSKKKIENSGQIKAGDGNNGGEIIFEAPEIEVKTDSILDVAGALGGGRIFVGGGYQGSGADHDGNAVDITDNAVKVTVDNGAVLTASATQSGDAGEIVVWADGETKFSGELYANAVDGAGGRAEVSGKETLDISGITVDLSGTTAAGHLLLDPEDVNIVSSVTGALSNEILDDDIQAILEGGASVTITTDTPPYIDNAIAVDSTVASGTGDVNFNAAVRIEWVNDGAENSALLTVHAAGDINALDDVIIQHTETGDGTAGNVVEGTGGVRLLAGGDINIGAGAPGAPASTSLKGVVIGSEFGETTLVAGDTDFDGTSEVAKDINIIGGEKALNYAHIGYRQHTLRGNNTGNDFASAGVHARNGKITLQAGKDINLKGGTGGAAFAQVGHGGVRELTSGVGTGVSLKELATITTSAEISGDIDVDYGVIAAGKLNLTGGITDINTAGAPTSTVEGLDHAKIGHGSVLVDDVPLVQQAITGDIDIDATVADSDLNMNTAFTATKDALVDTQTAQIGHGGMLQLEVGDGTLGTGTDVTHGQIQGNIDVDISGVLTQGVATAAAAGQDTFEIVSLLGHGGTTNVLYNGGSITGDETIDIIYGSIIGFDDFGDSSGAATTGTSITVNAGAINLISQNTTENSGAETGLLVDNYQLSQIGHSPRTSASRAENAGGGKIITVDETETVTGLDETTEGMDLNGETLEDLNNDAGMPTKLEAFDTAFNNAGDAATAADVVKQEAEGALAAADAELTAANDTKTVTAAVLSDATTRKNNAQTAKGDADDALDADPTNVTLIAAAAAAQTEFDDATAAFNTATTADNDAGTAVTNATDAKNAATTIAMTADADFNTKDAAFTKYKNDAQALSAIITAATTTSQGSAGTEVTTTAKGLDIEVTENRITGDITVTDIRTNDDEGIKLSSTIAAGLTQISRDVQITRIGHASTQLINSNGGGAGIDGGNVTIRQAHILDADILVQTLGKATDNQDITLETSIAAGLGAVVDNTTVAQIGHSADTFVSTGNGGAADSTIPDENSGDGGDITIIRGTVWDGGLTRDPDGDEGDNLVIDNTTDITVKSSNEIIIDSDTVAGLAAAERNNAESSIGHGFKQRLLTGDGGTSTDNGTAGGAAGGAGGDILVYQGLDVREYGIDNDAFDDYAYGLRGDINISATNKDGNAIHITSDDTSALTKTDWNTDISTIGHGDVLEAVSGKGGDGGAGLDGTGEDQTSDPKGEVAVYGGRGGHIDVQLGRHTGLDQYGTTGGSDMFSDTRIAGGNKADVGDTRALTLGEVAAPKRQGLSLIEGDIFVNVLGGTVAVEGSITNALSPSMHAISESIIGHAQRFTADAGDGGKAGTGNFQSQSQTVFQSEQTGEEFLNYASGIGSNRGGNGGDVRLTHGDITDRVIQHRIGDEHAEITHDTDADHTGSANVEFDAATGYTQLNTELVDGSSDIFMYLHDEDVDGNEQTNADSLVVKSTINSGFSEANGSIYSTVGHHIRLIGEGGKGGDGNSTNTEFDISGNSSFTSPYIAFDATPTSDSVDETAIQTGDVFIQPNASGGRGGDALVVNNDISGDIVINAARRVTVQSGDGHGGETIINATLGHTTDLFSATQAGGAAGDLFEQDTSRAFYDGGIINVGGGQNEDNKENSSTSTASTSLSEIDKEATFDHVLVDGNRDDQFNLENNGDSQSIASEDGIAVTDADRAAGTGSTFQTIANEFGSDPTADANAVIFHDEEADPQYIKDYAGAFVLNNAANNALYAESIENYLRYGRVVATYDGAQSQNPNEFFSLGGAPGTDGRISLEVFVDMDQDGDVDLVDFDRDGRLDIVDVDRDGRMDVIDGRANYVDVLNRDGVNAVPQDGGATNGISGLGVLDYVAVTGKGFNQTDAADGEYWTNHNELKSDDLLVDYNSSTDLLKDTNTGAGSDFVAYVSDFSTANGGRGGDAYSQVGYSSGDISVSTGNNDKGKADSLIVKTTAPDAVRGNGKDDFLRAIIGHNAVQISDAGGAYKAYRVGREGLNAEADEHVSANGGAAGNFAINGNGGRGGNAANIQGVIRDHYAGIDTGQVDITELDHLVGDIFINTPNDLDKSISNDAGRISITADIGSLSPVNHNLVSQIGHGSLSGSAGGNGGIGASNGSTPTAPDSGSQTELADGGDGGDAYITEHQIKGDITVMTGSDDLDGSNDFSIVMSAIDAHPLAGENQMVVQIGHGRQAEVTGGAGGKGDDGQFRGNGGAGGNATLTQNNILDSVITIDLVDISRGYDGNGLSMLTKSLSGSNDTYRAQIGHGDLGTALAGKGGDGTPEFEVLEQRNQTANGGIGGTATISQAGYSNDIVLDIGSNQSGVEGLQLISDAGTITNSSVDEHLLTTIGHGGLAGAIGGAGGEGGLNGAITGIPNEKEENLRDGDYFDVSNANGSDLATDGDSAGAIDLGNRIVLGTTRRGGDAGDAIVQQNVGGTGRTLSGRETNNDYGLNDDNGADITITVSDQYDDMLLPTDFVTDVDGNFVKDADGNLVRNDSFSEATFKSGSDGVLIKTIIGPGTNQNSALDVNSALVGHHNFAETTGADGGNAIKTSKSATISDGDGGDGGSGITTIGEVRGAISIDNEVDVTNPNVIADYDNSTAFDALDRNILITVVDGTPSDGKDHRGDARVGHMNQAQSSGGTGGKAAIIADDKVFPATISTQGGDGGDALTFQGQQEGNITLNAENSVIINATEGTAGQGALVAAAGHRVVAEAKAGDGNDGGQYEGDTNDQSIYFTYEALREFHHRRLTATDEAAFNALSEFEQQLVAPVTDYFENKQGEMEIFLNHLVGDTAELIQHNERDDDAIGGNNFSIPTLQAGDGHISGADDGEVETLVAILAAAGHGGNSSVTQGSVGLSGFSDELAASGDIKLTANAYRANDTSRGITVEATAGSVGPGFQMAHVGHQSEAHEVVAGMGSNLQGTEPGKTNGIGGDGGDAVVDQYALNGAVDLISNHEILISSKDAAPVAHETRAWVGHRLTIGSDYTVYRSENTVVAGDGGSDQNDEHDDAHNGNGGDVSIYQRGVISGMLRGSSTMERYDTEIALAALEDSDNDKSITIEALAPGPASPDVETHVGHDFLIHAVKAGDAGRRGPIQNGPIGASEGLLEGNGGDIFIAQTDLGADIDIVGRDAVEINVKTALASHAHLMIGHERTVGNSAESTDDVDGNVGDNPRKGSIKAGFGGDSYTEDVNGTAKASRVASDLTLSGNETGTIEDGDSGRIEIVTGKLTDSFEVDSDDSRLITITSITEDVDITSVSAVGSKSILEIGNQQQVIAETQSAGEHQPIPHTHTAGDAGGVFINRDTIDGDILIQAIDAQRGTAANGEASDGDARKGDGRQVVIDSKSGAASTAITQIGHETQFDVKTSTPVTDKAAFGEDRNFLFEKNLTNYVALKPAGTGEKNEATLRDAQNAVEDMRDVVRALELAHENIDRFPAADDVDDGTTANADQGELIALLADAKVALAAAEADLDNIGHGNDNLSEASAVNNILMAKDTTSMEQGYAQDLIDAATDYQKILDADIITAPDMGKTQASFQIADFAEGGDIVYGALPSNATTGSNPLNSHTDSIQGIATLAHTSDLTIEHAPTLVAEGFMVTDTGIVEGNVDILSGRDTDIGNTSITDANLNPSLKSVTAVIGNDTIIANNFGGDTFTPDDDIDDSVVQITATADNRSLTEIGHRRIMKNETSFGGGDTDTGPEEGGVAGDAGSIVTKNTTRGDISVQAEEVVIQTAGAAGADAELHLLHSSHTTNTAGWSDIQTLLGNGGDIYNTTIVSGGVAINAEQIASAVDAMDRKILATGLAETFIHMGHQAEDRNESKSDPNEEGGDGDAQTNLGSNRGGKVVSSQTVRGNGTDDAVDGDLVTITLDAAADGNASDLIIETAGVGGSDIRLGNGEDGGMKGIYQDGTSGINESDDGGEITLTQVVGGDIEISKVEDLHINVLGTGNQSVYIGHDAEQLGQSGEVNTPSKVLQYGERVTVTQTITGNVNVETTSTYTATLGADAGELHVGHEGTQSAFSADDSANPSDLEDVNNDGIADNGDNGAEGPSAADVNDNFNQPDVLATQIIEAGISIVTGEITLENLGTKNQIHYGHEAIHKAAVDGDQTVALGDPNSTGYVKASSKINADGSDIRFEAKSATGQLDTVLKHTDIHNADGDIQLDAKGDGKIQVGHSSTSQMGDVTTGSLVAEGKFDAEQIIGNATLDSNGNEVANTGDSVIEFRAVQDIIVASVDGETQVGHFIVETGNATSIAANNLNVDGNAATGLAEGDSELRQIVGSDIIFGDKTNQGSGGVGENGAGNNVVIETGAGRTIIGHQSPGSNEWQVEGTRSVTVQLLDGDITIEAGTDEGLDAPDGMVVASAAAAILDEDGDDDDLLLLSGADGTARIGHNMAGVDDTDPDSVANETQRSAGDIWVRAGGDLHILGGAVGHEHYDFDSTTPTSKNATPESLASATPIRDRIRGNTTIAAGQNSAPEDSTTIANILKIDGTPKAVEINSGYGGQGGKDVAGQLRFFLPAQEGLTILTAATFNDSGSNGDAVPTRSSNPDNIFEKEGGNNHEHFFELASESQPYTDEFIGAGNFTFYFEPKPSTGQPLPEFSPFLYRGSNDSGFDVIYLDDDGTSAGGAMNTDGLSEDYIGTSSYEVACDEQSQSGSVSQEGSTSSGECSEVSDQYEGIQPGYGANTEWSGQAGGNASSVIPYLDEDDELGENKQVVGFTVYDEPVITTQTIAVEQTSASYFNVKTVTRKLPKYDGRVITRNSPSGINHMNGFGRTVTNSSPFKNLNSPITTTTQGSGVNSFDVSNNAVFSTTTHQFFTGFDAGNDYQVTAVDNRIGTYVDDTGIDAYIAQHAGAMSFASSYQVFEQKAVE